MTPVLFLFFLFLRCLVFSGGQPSGQIRRTIEYREREPNMTKKDARRFLLAASQAVSEGFG